MKFPKEFQIFPVPTEGLLAWANKHWKQPPFTLRRTLSLMRLADCKIIIIEYRKWTSTDLNKKTCLSSLESGRESCALYIETLLKWDYKFFSKDCVRLSFFNIVFNEAELELINERHFLGYTIIQEDNFQDPNKQYKTKPYLTETILNFSTKEEKYITYGSQTVQVKIKKRDFNLTGNYFAQQNGITNCCVNAAIKMALRAHFPEITADAINQAGNKNHAQKGIDGLFDNDIKNIITKLTKWSTVLYKAEDFNYSLDFLKIIYYAIESRLPTILLFDTHKEGHAIAFIGHTFNSHNWWSYGLNSYFKSPRDKIGYLPSFLWCDNFILQDDNIGPFYFMPVHYLPDFPKKLKEKILNWLGQRLFFSHKIPLLRHNPLRVIVAYPKEMKFFKATVKNVERFAFSELKGHIESQKESNNLPTERNFKDYFYYPYEEKALILRTFILNKETYIESLKSQPEPIYDLCGKKLNERLPKLFWIIEISIPELFWINKAKVGEIIIDPQEFIKSNERKGVVYLRVPNQVNFMFDDLKGCFRFVQKSNHSSLIKSIEMSI